MKRGGYEELQDEFNRQLLARPSIRLPSDPSHPEFNSSHQVAVSSHKVAVSSLSVTGHRGAMGEE